MAIYDQLESLMHLPENLPFCFESDLFPYPIREKLVGLGSRPRYRAIFTVRGNEVVVLTIRAGEQDRFSPSDLDHR